MAKYEYSKYKIIIDPESKKVQGLRVGDVVRRQYFDAPNLIYSLMVVLDTGVDAINGKESHYFVGALLEGDEPKTGELLNFVRVTSLCDKERGGALYLTSTGLGASDSESPFMDVIDGLGFENSLLYQPKVQRISGKQKYLLGGDVGYPEMLLVAYRVRASEPTTATVSVGYSDEIDGIDEVEVSTDWQYKLSAIVACLASKIEVLKNRVQALQSKSEDKILKEWMDTQDVCMALNISSRTLQTYRDKGRLPYSQIGSKFFYKPDDVMSLMFNVKM